MESNFNFLNNIIETNNNSKVKLWIRDASFLISEIEKQLYSKKIFNIGYKLRMLSEIVGKIILFSIKNNDNIEFIEWSKKIEKQSYEQKKYLNIILREYPNNGKIELLENFKIKNVIDELNKLNGLLHYEDSGKHPSFLEEEGKIRHREPSFQKILKYIEIFFDIFIYISKINNFVNNFNTFNKKIYE